MSIPVIYRLFAEEVADVGFVCRPGCATCCTRSVTLTTGEAELIMDYLQAEGRDLPPLPRDEVPLRPALTTNALAACCLAGREPPLEAESPWQFEPCFFLRDRLCSIYPVRPFACRSFGSTVDCAREGTAEAPEWLVTLNTVVNQLLESLDRSGRWGNLADILAYLAPSGRERISPPDDRLLANRPAPGLLVLPAERARLNRFLSRVAAETGLDLRALGLV